MKEPVNCSLLGLFFNIFSFLYLDYRLFISSLIYMSILTIIYFLVCPMLFNPLYLLFFNVFFAFFNLQAVKLWNFMEMDDVYENPWANIFMLFKRWFLRFFLGLISFVLILKFIAESTGIIVLIIKIIAVVFLMPAASFLIEQIQSAICNTLLVACKITYKE